MPESRTAKKHMLHNSFETKGLPRAAICNEQQSLVILHEKQQCTLVNMLDSITSLPHLCSHLQHNNHREFTCCQLYIISSILIMFPDTKQNVCYQNLSALFWCGQPSGYQSLFHTFSVTMSIFLTPTVLSVSLVSSLFDKTPQH